jgi:replicative DNA helicase
VISSPEAEFAVIGCCLFDAASCDEAFERLRPHHFARRVNGLIWTAMLSARKLGKMVEPIGIHEAVKADGDYQQTGAMAYLADAIDKAALYALSAHVELLIDRTVRREVQALTTEAQRLAADTFDGSGEAVLGFLERGAADIAREGATPTALPAGLDALEMVEASFAGHFLGSPTGLGCIDHVTGGIRPDDVWFIAGRTSMGKSVQAVGLARGVAQQGRGVMFFSLEMPRREVQARLISDIAYDRGAHVQDVRGGNIRYGDILKGRGTPWQQDRARDAARALASLPIVVADRGGLTIEDIRIQAQRQLRAWDKAGVPRGAVIIDHIGLVKPLRRTDSKAADTSDLVNELKPLAKQLQTPIVALAQVNRNTESRNDKRPTLADLNWSGSIEQIGDFICLLYREAYYLERSADEGDKAEAYRRKYDLELIIAKNRSGPICTVEAYCDVACNVIRDRDERERAYG